MHRFAFRRGELWCEGTPVSRIAESLGTPLYLYSYQTILDHYRKLKTAFATVRPLICFAVKANTNAAILRTLAKAGAGFDVVSGGELARVLRVGAQAQKIVFASVGKTLKEIEAAVRAGILFLNVESAQEMERIEEVCRRLNLRQEVSLRLNPEVDPHTHAFIATGRRASKFGMEIKAVEKILATARRFPHLIFRGVHIHIGSQILEARPFQQAIERALAFIEKAQKRGFPIEWLNVGGGLGIVYRNETPLNAKQFARAVLPLVKSKGLKLILEPGRFIVGNSGILLTRVLYLKASHAKRFAIVDAGMNDLIRPSLYGAYHEIAPVLRNRSGRRVKTSVVGPICESGDFFASDRMLPSLHPGDLLAIFGAGAYGFTMASNYNSRPRAAEAMVRGNRWHLIRRRESVRDLIHGERIPAFLR